MKKNLKAVIIGFGSIGKRHLKNLSNLVDKNNIIIFTRKKIKSKNFKFTNKFDDIINFNPNLTVIANASVDHLKVAQKIMNKSNKILIEKPLSDKSKKIKDFIDYWKKMKIPIFIGYNLRYFNSLIYLKKLVQNNFFGKIYYVNIDACSNLVNWRKNIHYSQSVSAQKKLGGGVLLELSHELDYLRWIFGEPDYLISKIKKLSKLKIDVEDTASIIFDYKKKNMLINMFLNFFQKKKSRTCTIIGSQRTAKWDLFKNNVSIYDENNDKWNSIKFKKNNMDNTYKKEIYDLIYLKKTNKKTYYDLVFNLNTLKLIEAIRKSSTSDKKIIFNKEI